MTSGNNLQQEWYKQAKLWSAIDIQQLGSVLVVAPHQDDESLGCGGIIALLRKMDIRVHVIFTTNGSFSHPNSKKYPFEKRIELREKEALQALKLLGVASENVIFLRMQDGKLQFPEYENFVEASRQVSKWLNIIKPETILLPWRRDPHTDHRATWHIVNEAVLKNDMKVRRLEYLIWLWERAAINDLPQPSEMQIWQIDISEVIDLKQQAIYAHLSQTTRLIDDDPEGFILSPEVLEHFNKPYEIFVEDKFTNQP